MSSKSDVLTILEVLDLYFLVISPLKMSKFPKNSNFRAAKMVTIKWQFFVLQNVHYWFHVKPKENPKKMYPFFAFLTKISLKHRLFTPQKLLWVDFTKYFPFQQAPVAEQITPEPQPESSKVSAESSAEASAEASPIPETISENANNEPTEDQSVIVQNFSNFVKF